MSGPRGANPLGLWTAMAAAALMMAHQVGGKSIRDALFLSTHGAEDLPKMVAAAAVLSVLMGGASSRLFARLSPSRVVPWGFLLSGALQAGEWWLVGRNAEWGSVVVYLHTVAFAAVLLSSFWLLLSERTNPVEAKKRYGRIAGMGTAGSVLGGLMAARWQWLFPGASEASLLLALGAAHVLCGVVLLGMGEAVSPGGAGGAVWSSPRKVLKAAPHMRYLALLVLLGTASAATLDFVFKASATQALGRGEDLLAFFAYFNTAVALSSFALQTLLSQYFLERFGVARTVAALPMGLAGTAGAALVAPVFGLIVCARGVEAGLRGSLFRAGYELLYSPIPPAEKRAAKTVIDVGCDRLGDAAGAALCQAVLALPALPLTNALLAVTAVLALANAWVARRLDRVYVAVLERGLLNRAREVLLSGAGDWTMDRDLLESRVEVVPSLAPIPAATAPAARRQDPLLDRLSELRCGEPERVKRALCGENPLEGALVPVVLDLLAWDLVAPDARKALQQARETITGQLADRLLDGRSDFAIRRRIPAILAARGGARAVEGLMAGLNDERFEVRYRCARALDAVVEQDPGLRPPAAAVYAMVERELSVDEAIWRSRRLLDEKLPEEQPSHLDELLRERADRNLEHLFSLLALILPRPPLKAAFRSLHTDDDLLRALALEYLEGVLPQALKERLRALVGRGVAASDPGSGEGEADVLDRLLASHQSIEMKVRQLVEGPPRELPE